MPEIMMMASREKKTTDISQRKHFVMSAMFYGRILVVASRMSVNRESK
jgi:hypothetical protein